MTKIKNPKAILITGASSGIGAALAHYYAAPGIHLFLSARNQERLTRVAKECQDKGAVVHTAFIDVTDQGAMNAWVKGCDQVSPLDLVIANAGISGGTADSGQGASLPGESFGQVREIFAINLTGTLNTVEPALEVMGPRQSGQVAVMGSLASFSGWPGAPAYSASKGAVRLYGEALRGAWAGSGIHVNVILPGFIKTPMTAVNPYPMPFLLSEDRAAEKIADGLARNKGRIAFPFGTYFLAGLVGLLPYKLSAVLLKKLPEKPAISD